MTRYFTVEEANQALEIIRPIVEQILKIRAAVLARSPEVWPVIEKAAGNGGGKAAMQVEREFERLDAYVRQIQSLGAVLKDINIGLIDFPALRDGREIYLCWRYGEAAVQYWHDLDAGFTGRQSI
jgi:hypothetical protein